MEISSGQSTALRVLAGIIGAFSVFVSFILAFLILYANRFLIKRRKKEFGLYMIMGMGKWMTSRILMWETLFVGVLSLAAGLALGIFVSHGMAAVTAKLLGAGIGSFRFIFSGGALIKTLGCFGLAFALSLLFNIVMVRKQKLIDLLYAAKKNERFKAPRPVVSVLIFISALCCLGVAYKIVLSDGFILLRNTIYIPIALGAAGTFFFFFSLSGFFLRLLQQSKGLYLKNLNMFVLRQINSKINTTYVSMTLVCLMLFLSVCTLSSGMGLAEALTNEMRENAPFDATFSVQAEYGAGSDVYPGIDIAAAASDRGAGLSSFAAEYTAARYYGADVTVALRTGDSELTLNPNFMKLSDYNAVLAMQGLAPIALDADYYALNCNMNTIEWQDILNDYAANGGEIEIAGRRIVTSPDKYYKHTLEVSPNKQHAITVIVSDELLADAPVKRDFLHVNYPEEGGEYEKMCVSALIGFEPVGSSGVQLDGGLETRVRVLEYTHSATTTIAYMAIYLGVVALLMAATVLAIGQLSEAGDNTERYGLLRKIGAEDSMINAALFMQILVCFGAPVLLALVHAAVGIGVASELVSVFSEMNILGSSLVAAVVIVGIYGAYFLATYFGSKSIIDTNINQRRFSE
jgi:putative ABC transport system permease protein